MKGTGMKVRKKVAECEARQFDRGIHYEIVQWCGAVPHPHGLTGLKLTDKDGALRAIEYGDWIIKSEEGFEVFPEADFWDIFEEVQ